MFCHNCGNELPDSAVFCNQCGERVRPAPEPAPEPKPEPKPEPVVIPAPDPAPKPQEPPVRRTVEAQNEPAFKPAPEPVVPAENRPLSPWAYFGYGILFSLPVLGLILLIIFSFAGKNVNRKNYARSYWCWLIIVLGVILIATVLLLLGVLRGPIETGIAWLRDTGLGWLSKLFG